MLGLHWTPKGLGTDLQQESCQSRSYSRVGQQGCMILYVTHQKLLLNTQNKSGILAIEIDKFHNHF